GRSPLLPQADGDLIADEREGEDDGYSQQRQIRKRNRDHLLDHVGQPGDDERGEPGERVCDKPPDRLELVQAPQEQDRGRGRKGRPTTLEGGDALPSSLVGSVEEVINVHGDHLVLLPGDSRKKVLRTRVLEI